MQPSAVAEYSLACEGTPKLGRDNPVWCFVVMGGALAAPRPEVVAGSGSGRSGSVSGMRGALLARPLACT